MLGIEMAADLWRKGSLSYRGKKYFYWMKVYEKGSVWGIFGGRVSKLRVECQDQVVCNFDRGWDVEPVDHDAQEVLRELLVYCV